MNNQAASKLPRCCFFLPRQARGAEGEAGEHQHLRHRGETTTTWAKRNWSEAPGHAGNLQSEVSMQMQKCGTEVVQSADVVRLHSASLGFTRVQQRAGSTTAQACYVGCSIC